MEQRCSVLAEELRGRECELSQITGEKEQFEQQCRAQAEEQAGKSAEMLENLAEYMLRKRDQAKLMRVVIAWRGQVQLAQKEAATAERAADAEKAAQEARKDMEVVVGLSLFASRIDEMKKTMTEHQKNDSPPTRKRKNRRGVNKLV